MNKCTQSFIYWKIWGEYGTVLFVGENMKRGRENKGKREIEGIKRKDKVKIEIKSVK
jgi:hypothetical protein